MSRMGHKVTDKVKKFVAEVESTTPTVGVDINPERIEGESKQEFARRMYAIKQRAKGFIVAPTAEEKAARYAKAFSYFMDGLPEEPSDDPAIIYPENSSPTVTEVGLRLKMHLPTLLTYSIERNWEMQRANKRAAERLAGGEARLQLAERIDRVILDKMESVVVQAAESYDELIRKIRALPTDHAEMTESDDPGETARPASDLSDMPGTAKVGVEHTGPGPRNRTGPKRSRATLLKLKLNLLNDAVKGFMDMSESARNQGLLIPVHNPKNSDESPKNSIDISKLASLNMTLIQVQQGEQNPPEKNVTPNQ